ncbi:MAG: hypothetical protein MK289_07845 [Trichodesmium sp. ALOHA_ZT_67]|uniref:hypothetical protein n=1 Tax=Trichodesmium erythraeum TaxID=1206 RepID=UPI0003266F5D|nr:hypothetical protein [Trichodesmium erythraeum GBRTRLIN201]MCH2048379.1 hypothetical protein [Trichodesmium sp. ALOHA_ZT_67]
MIKKSLQALGQNYSQPIAVKKSDRSSNISRRKKAIAPQKQFVSNPATRLREKHNPQSFQQLQVNS